MASVEQVRAGIALATDKASESIGALQQAATAIEQAQTAFAQASEGSSQSDAEQINGLLQQALQSIGDVQQTVNAAISSAESYASRL
ncbi:hypothetical protein [Streptoalloteichus hindustanus]|uniref:Uncharacterized protein n=1 Tax=Streptoalloteichus hindustanus TaxID=2017 RepID=A0A1M5PEY9_STRHI|nr:hypothetical protein [Streptoalloteichus hindustanus]SHH00278.1 hypothetical protein SAMN05444320_11834 [Streptoalloteichus hindustanus]